jgi:uncharacterized cupin superfamily protein
MAKFVAMGIDGIEPEEYGPEEGNVISGNPWFRLWSLDEAKGGLSSGIWESTTGKWRFENAHWEYCRILAGVSVITEDGGIAHTVRAGDSFILRADFSGTWEVTETTRKDYVIRA